MKKRPKSAGLTHGTERGFWSLTRKVGEMRSVLSRRESGTVRPDWNQPGISNPRERETAPAMLKHEIVWSRL